MRKDENKKPANKEKSVKQKRQGYTVDSFDTNLQKKQATNASRIADKEKKWRIAKFYFKCFFVSLVVSFIVFFLITSPDFTVKKIDIKGCKYSDEDKIRKISDSFFGTNLFIIKKGKITKQLSGISEIKEVKISRKFPDKINIRLIERKAVATIENDTRTYLVDKEKFVFHILKEQEDIPDVTQIIVSYKIDTNMDFEKSHKRFEEKVDAETKKLLKQTKDNSDMNSENIKENADEAKKERKREIYNLEFAFNISQKAKQNKLKIKNITIKNNNYAILQMANNGPVIEFGPLADIDTKVTLITDIYELKKDINEEAGEIYIINERAATYKKKSSMNKNTETEKIVETTN